MRLPIICLYQAWCWLLVWDYFLIMLRTHPFIPILLFLIENRHWILSNAFSTFPLTFKLEMIIYSQEVAKIIERSHIPLTQWLHLTQLPVKTRKFILVQCPDLTQISLVLQVLACVCACVLIVTHFITCIGSCIYHQSKDTSSSPSGSCVLPLYIHLSLTLLPNPGNH